MAEREVDPIVSRALRLMLTRTSESREQLRQLLEDEIRKRTGKIMGHLLYPIETLEDSTDSSSRQKSLENRTVSLHIEDCSKESHIAEVNQEDSETEINIEILEEDLACVVCRVMDVAPRNRLIECAGCHSLYHQECHRPPVSEDDMENPRSVWYCTSCTKTMSRPPFQIPPSTMTSRSSSQSPGSPQHSSKQAGGRPSLLSTFMQSNKSFGGSTAAATSQPASSSSSSTTAATSSACSTPSPPSTTHTTASTSSVATKSSMAPKINVISADKRIANMKKKAAKQQEKRKHSK